jgi:hypothetical protein
MIPEYISKKDYNFFHAFIFFKELFEGNTLKFGVMRSLHVID